MAGTVTFEREPIRVGECRDVRIADQLVARLFEVGYSKDQVSVVSSEPAKTAQLRASEGVRAEPTAEVLSYLAALRGSLLGGAFGVAAGILLGVGAVVAGGTSWLLCFPLMLLCGAQGLILGTFLDQMRMRGIETEAADFHDQGAEPGTIVVSVDTSKQGPLDSPRLAERVFADMGVKPLALPKMSA